MPQVHKKYDNYQAHTHQERCSKCGDSQHREDSNVKLVSTNVEIVTNMVISFDVDFSYCWLNLEVSWYSLEQYIWLYCRQVFNYCCSLLQVWKDTVMQVLIWGPKMLTEHAQMHAGKSES